MNYSTAAVDVGFGQTKWAVRLESQIITGSFASLAPIASANTVSTTVGTFSKRNTIKVEIDGSAYEVGPDVRLAIGGSSSGRALSEDFPQSKNYRALLLGALYYAGVDHVEILILGLPVNTMNLYSDMLKEFFKNPADVNGRRITVGRVIVIPQPVGSLAMYGSTHSTTVKNGNTRLVIDPGYVTTDWVVANGYDMIDARSGGRMGGVSHVLKHVAELISTTYGGGKLDRIERIDEAIVSGKSFIYFKHEIDQAKLNEFLLLSKQVIEKTVKEIKTRVGDVDDLQSIIITGGGAKFYEAVIRKTFPLNNILLLEEPAFTNVIGFLLVGESMHRRSMINV